MEEEPILFTLVEEKGRLYVYDVSKPSEAYLNPFCHIGKLKVTSIDIPVDFMVCALGGKWIVNYTIFTKCMECRGMGGKSGGLCPVCRGKNPYLSGNPSICEHCNGSGIKLVKKCS